MITRQTIAAILTTTAMAYSIATPAQAASLLVGPRLDIAACSSDKPANPILANKTDGQGGWYWIEIMRYSDTAKSANLIVASSTSQLPLNLDVYVVFPFTALAVGPRPGTTVVLQETYARQRTKD